MEASLIPAWSSNKDGGGLRTATPFEMNDINTWNWTEAPAGKVPNTITRCLELKRNGQQIQDDAGPRGEPRSRSVPG